MIVTAPQEFNSRSAQMHPLAAGQASGRTASMRALYVGSIEDPHHHLVQFCETAGKLVRSLTISRRTVARLQRALKAQHQTRKGIGKLDRVMPAWLSRGRGAQHLFETVEPLLDLLQPLFHRIHHHPPTLNPIDRPPFSAVPHCAHFTRLNADKLDHNLDQLKAADCDISADEPVGPTTAGFQGTEHQGVWAERIAA